MGERDRKRELSIDVRFELHRFSVSTSTSFLKKKNPKTNSFCYPCIRRWSDVESACPLCKRRFARLSKVVLVGGGNGNERGGRRRTGEGEREAQELTRSALLSLATASVVETLSIPERRQQTHYETAEAAEAAARLAELTCVCCGGGGDDHLLLLCDGCDAAVSFFFKEVFFLFLFVRDSVFFSFFSSEKLIFSTFISQKKTFNSTTPTASAWERPYPRATGSARRASAR